MQTTNNKLATIIAELDTLESQRRAMLDEYMPIKNRIIELTEEKEKLEEQLMSEEQVEDDKKFDELIGSLGVEEVEIPQRLPKAWSHADDENDQDR